VMMTSGPAATVGEILTMPFPRPRRWGDRRHSGNTSIRDASWASRRAWRPCPFRNPVGARRQPGGVGCGLFRWKTGCQAGQGRPRSSAWLGRRRPASTCRRRFHAGWRSSPTGARAAMPSLPAPRGLATRFVADRLRVFGGPRP
jgi:hypothetical protein